MRIPLKKAKDLLFSKVRFHLLTKKIKNISNFLASTEIVSGCDDSCGKKVLVASPHPDDEAIGCGGTIRQLAEAGSIVDVVFMTKGEKGALDSLSSNPSSERLMAGKRVLEAEEAKRILGVHHISFLPGRDGDLHLQRDLHRELLLILDKGNYDILFCPWPYDGNSDHASTFRIARDALARYPRDIAIWMFEVWGPLPANRIVPIDSTFDAKMEAIRCYRTQHTTYDYSYHFKALAEYRSLLVPPSKFAEAFLVGHRSFILSAFHH